MGQAASMLESDTTAAAAGTQISGFQIKVFLLYLITFFLVSLIVVMFQYSRVQREVNRRSRCIRKRMLNSIDDEYSVQLTTLAENLPMYTVTYSPRKREMKYSCGCTKGDVANNWENVPLYNWSTNTTTSQAINCSCDRNYTATPTYYSGDPLLINYMKDPNNTTFFTRYLNQ